MAEESMNPIETFDWLMLDDVHVTHPSAAPGDKKTEAFYRHLTLPLSLSTPRLKYSIAMAIGPTAVQHAPSQTSLQHPPHLVGLPVRSHLTAAQVAEAKEAQRKPKKRRYWIQRDSLNRRNALLVGKEGSRRRNRWDNNNFTFHPHAILDPDDLTPPGYPQTNVQWDTLSLTSEDIDFYCTNQPKPSHPTVLPFGPAFHRKLRSNLKRSNVPQGLVSKFENELRSFLQHMVPRDGHPELNDWVLVEDGENGPVECEAEDGEEPEDFLIWEIQNGFGRFVIHSMCKYYDLVSFSKDMDDGRRLTFVQTPGQRRLTQKDCCTPYIWPAQTFFDYLFI